MGLCLYMCTKVSRHFTNDTSAQAMRTSRTLKKSIMFELFRSYMGLWTFWIFPIFVKSTYSLRSHLLYISTSDWSAQHPNTGQNIQHTSHVQNSLLGVRSSGFSLLVSLITWWTRWSRSCLEDPTTRSPGANLTWKQFNKIVYTCKTHG